MTNKLSIIIGAGIILILGFVSINFYAHKVRLKVQLSQSEEICKKIKLEIKNIEEERDKMIKENDKLRDDALAYAKFTTQLQDQLALAQTNLEERDKSIAELSVSVVALKEEIEKMGREMVEGGTINEEITGLKEKINSLEAELKNEKVLYYYNLGVAYVQAKLFNEAIEAYEKSLSFESNNPEAYYNLGLLYENFKLEPEKAVIYYQKYLEYKPEAEDKQEVQYWIESLNDIVYQQLFPEEVDKQEGEKKIEVNLVK